MPRCKICKNKFEAKYFLQKTCFEPSCIISFKDLVQQKEWNERKKKLKIELYPKETKKALQIEINKLVRLIDAKFGYTCIDCNKPYGKQVDAAHYTSVGSNDTIRFHLDNIHSADSYCNNYKNTHILDYYEGLISRYGKEYAEYVKNELPRHKKIKLMSNEVHEKTTLVRKIIRDFDTFNFSNSLEARSILNGIIGIYEKK